MSKFTPGPWKAEPEFSLPRDVSAWIMAGKIRIACCDAGELSVTENQFNARLIAAAPDLLRVCKQLRDALIRYAGPETALYEIGDANQAIAKAEGMEPSEPMQDAKTQE